jgi:hypothetical protein
LRTGVFTEVLLALLGGADLVVAGQQTRAQSSQAIARKHRILGGLPSLAGIRRLQRVQALFVFQLGEFFRLRDGKIGLHQQIGQIMRRPLAGQGRRDALFKLGEADRERIVDSYFDFSTAVRRRDRGHVGAFDRASFHHHLSLRHR